MPGKAFQPFQKLRTHRRGISVYVFIFGHKGFSFLEQSFYRAIDSDDVFFPEQLPVLFEQSVCRGLRNGMICYRDVLLSGELIQNHLGLEITLTDAGCGEKNLKMRYVFFVDYESASAAPDCSFYLLSFLEEVNQAVRVLGSGSLHSSCRVRIREAGPSPVMVIKKVFELGGGNLIAARNLVHAAPDAFLYAESREHAETIKKALEAAGAEAELA